MDSIDLKVVLSGQYNEKDITVAGWVRTHRQSKKVAFIGLSDGTCTGTLQLVFDPELTSYAQVASKISTGASVIATGLIVASPGKGQSVEMQVKEITLVGEADPETFPLQKKGHTLEFLRDIQHLRARSNTLGAVFRLRSIAAMAVHKYFTENGFYYVHTPIVTTSDCEGAGEMFRVTTLDLLNPPRTEKGHIDFNEDFFKAEASLTVSGQLEGEAFATALKKIYTFGPTFRAENSNTPRHLAEFWMIEPEVAFMDLKGNMKLAESFIKYLTLSVLNDASSELEFLHSREWFNDANFVGALEAITKSEFQAITYTDAIEILKKSGKHFEYAVDWGIDLQTEHERFLTDEYVKGPVFVVDYPKEIKAFYMRMNEDEKTVRAMDLLVPRLGEIIGGSQREEREEVLKSRMVALNLDPEKYWWYLELRKFGTVPHAGFGLGFERFIMYVSGMQNIRDVIPFPRHPGSAKF